MKRYIALIVVVLLASFAMSGIALAKADRQKLVPYIPFGLDEDASGKAIVNYPKGDVVLVITVTAKGLEPNKEYIVGSFESLDAWQFFHHGTFTTNENGNGHFHINYGRTSNDTLPPTDHIYINVSEDDEAYEKGIVLIDEDA